MSTPPVRHSPARVQSLLLHSAAARCLGRRALRASLARLLLHGEAPLVVALHGVAGIGKTVLAGAFASDAQDTGVPVLWLDGGSFEPTPAGVLGALAARCEPAAVPTLDAIAEGLAAMGERVLVVIDAYERCRLVDDWLRQEWLPRMGVGVRLLLVGRDVPVPAWRRAAGWEALFQALPVGPLDEVAAAELLRREHLPSEQAVTIARWAAGHPLALRLAAGVAGCADRPTGSDWHATLDALVSLWMEDVPDARLRRALNATSVVRRITVSLLRALVPDEDPAALLESLAALPLATATADGLTLDDSMRDAIAARFAAIDPQAHRAARRAAWQQLHAESRAAAPGELWRYTADLLFLVPTPSVREVFFPRGTQPMAVETARGGDLGALCAMAERLHGADAAAALRHWTQVAPRAFRVVRDETGAVTAFSCVLRAGHVDPRHLGTDPATRAWQAHLADDPVAAGDEVLLLARLVADDAAPAVPSTARAALVLDLKRHYLELRPRLKRLYAEVEPGADFDAFLRPAGFLPLPEHPVRWGDRQHDSVMLDFGPGSVDGWLSRLVAMSVLEPPQPAVALDEAARELAVDGRRVALTRREFEVMQHLMRHAGQAVKRGDLLDDIWGTRYEGGSNVIDVVVRSLRRKLGGRAGVIETVTRFGYRFRQP